MENKKLVSVILIITVFLFITSSFAETIVLKSGKKVEGKIIERADKHIKLDFQGVPITYYVEDIETIDGETLSSPENSNENNIKGYEEWSNSVMGYINSMKMLKNKARVIEQATLKADEATSKGGQEAVQTVQRILTETTNKLILLIGEMKALNPPKDLEKYHETVIQTIEYRKQVYGAVAKGDKDAVVKYTLASENSQIQEGEELKRVSAIKGAPKGVIDYFDAVIRGYKREGDRGAITPVYVDQESGLEIKGPSGWEMRTWSLEEGTKVTWHKALQKGDAYMGVITHREKHGMNYTNTEEYASALLANYALKSVPVVQKPTEVTINNVSWIKISTEE